MTTLLALAVAALDQRDDRFVDTGFAEAVETASQQAVEEVASTHEEVDSLTPLLGSALDDTQRANDVETADSAAASTDEREQLAAAIQRAASEEHSLSADDSDQLAATFLHTLKQQVCGVSGDKAVGSPIQQVGDRALREGAIEDAESAYRLAVSCARELDANAAEAAGLRSLGNVALQRSEREAAEEYHREALDIAREADLQSIEADCLASLGMIEASRGYPETAETYLTESLDLKRLLGDRFGEATCLASLGNVAESHEAYQEAVERYTQALELFGPDEPREELETLQGLITAERAVGDDEAARIHCEQGLSRVADTDLADGDAYDRWFRSTAAQLSGDADALGELYETALEHLRADDRRIAFELLEGLWAARQAVETDTERFELCLRAGVGFVALHRLADRESVEGDHAPIVETLDAHRERLSAPATRLLDVLVSEDAEDVAEPDTTHPDDADPSLAALEQLAYSVLAESLMKTSQETKWYGTALTGLLDGRKEPNEVLKLLLTAWDQRDNTGATRVVVGAGLVAEAHRELFDVELPSDRQTVLAVARESDQLSEPLNTLRTRLEGEPVEPPAAADSIDGQVSLIELETVVVNRIIRQIDR